MSNNYDSIINEIDTQDCEYYYSDRKQRAVVKGLALARKENNKDKENEMFYELALLNNTFGGQMTKEGIEQISDKWDWAYQNIGEPLKNYPFSEWNEKTIPYYKKRINESKNKLNKAWYNYILWTLTKGEKDSYKYGIESSRLFFLSTFDYLPNKGYEKYYRTFPFCFKIALKIATKLNKKDLFIKIIEHLVNCTKQEISENEIRWSLELYRILADYSFNLPESNANKIIKSQIVVIDKIIQDYIKENDFHLARSFIDIILIFTKRLSLSIDYKKYAILKAETYVLEAKSRKGEALIESCFYQDALKEYSKLGDSQKIEELKEKIKVAESKIKWKKLSVKIEIPPYFEDNFINKICLMDPEKMITFITYSDKEFIPSFTNSIKLANDLRKRSSLSSLFIHKISSKDLPLKQKDPNKNLFEYEVKKYFLMEVKMRENLLEKVFDEFKNKQLNEKNIFNVLNKSKNINANSKKILKKAINHHFKKDYLSSIHLFVPQIEATIREIRKNRGIFSISIKKMKDIELREKIFGSLLESEDTVKILGIDFVEYLKTKLTDEEFENHRNNLCHGQMEFRDFNKILSTSLIYIFLKLSKI